VFFESFLFKILPERVVLRYKAVLNFQRNVDNGFLTRLYLSVNSIKTQFSSAKSFLFGIGNHLGEDSMWRIGQHSLITDFMAKYGCIGITFLVYFFSYIKKKYKCYSMDVKENALVVTTWIIFLIMSVMTNSFRAENGISCFLLLSVILEPKRNTYFS
jgi:hypothetical protein